MVTRSGDLDPSVVTFLMKKENLKIDEIENILNKNSGLTALSEMPPDFREIEEASNNGNEMAKIAVDEFNYAIAGYIAKYSVALNGTDYIVFTGGIGENHQKVIFYSKELIVMQIFLETAVVRKNVLTAAI